VFQLAINYKCKALGFFQRPGRADHVGSKTTVSVSEDQMVKGAYIMMTDHLGKE
jgi:hypothetical protein